VSQLPGSISSLYRRLVYFHQILHQETTVIHNKNNWYDGHDISRERSLIKTSMAKLVQNKIVKIIGSRWGPASRTYGDAVIGTVRKFRWRAGRHASVVFLRRNVHTLVLDQYL